MQVPMAVLALLLAAAITTASAINLHLPFTSTKPAEVDRRLPRPPHFPADYEVSLLMAMSTCCITGRSQGLNPTSTDFHMCHTGALQFQPAL